MAEEAGAAVPTAQKLMDRFRQAIIGQHWRSGVYDCAEFHLKHYFIDDVEVFYCDVRGYWGEPTQEFLDVALGSTPEQRMLAVLKWFISTLKGQYTARETQTGSEKKPFNPILGETFLGQWDTSSKGPTTLVSEQVSHHPPITAYRIQNKQAGVTLTGHNGQRTTFSGTTIVVKQVGFAMLTIDLPNNGGQEQYLITLPKLRIEGLLYGSPYVELTENSYIQSSSGFHTAIEYKGKGWMSGKAHSFKAVVADKASHVAQSPLYTIEGQWTETSKFAKGTNGRLHKKDDVFLDVQRASPSWRAVSVKPIAEQSEMESRRVWQTVADGIRRGDFENATAAKTKLENEQRAKRKAEAASGNAHKAQYFVHVPKDPSYSKLAQEFDFKPEEQEGYHFA